MLKDSGQIQNDIIRVIIYHFIIILNMILLTLLMTKNNLSTLMELNVGPCFYYLFLIFHLFLAFSAL